MKKKSEEYKFVPVEIPNNKSGIIADKLVGNSQKYMEDMLALCPNIPIPENIIVVCSSTPLRNENEG